MDKEQLAHGYVNLHISSFSAVKSRISVSVYFSQFPTILGL